MKRPLDQAELDRVALAGPFDYHPKAGGLPLRVTPDTSGEKRWTVRRDGAVQAVLAFWSKDGAVHVALPDWPNSRWALASFADVWSALDGLADVIAAERAGGAS